MNWNAVGAVGQIMGSLATFVTVGYLVVQVNDTETESRRAHAQTRVERSMDISLTLINNERLAEVEMKFVLAAINKNLSVVPASSIYAGLGSFITTATQQANVNFTEAYLLSQFYTARWNSFSETIIHLDDLLPTDRLQFEYVLRGTLGNPGFAFFYQTLKPALEAQAVSYVDSLNIEVGDGQSLSSPIKSAKSG